MKDIILTSHAHPLPDSVAGPLLVDNPLWAFFLLSAQTIERREDLRNCTEPTDAEIAATRMELNNPERYVRASVLKHLLPK